MKYSKYIFIASLFISCNNIAENKSIDQSSSVVKQELSKNQSFIEKHPNGRLKISGEIVDGQRDGKWISYFENGTKQSEHNYSKGKLHGNIAVFSIDGALLYQGFYLEGKEHGKWLYYNHSSNQTKEVWYENGVKK